MRLSELTARLKGAGIENARDEARALFAHLGGYRREELIFSDPELSGEEIEEAAKRREAREPLQYIIGSVDFYRESYEVHPDCLIPRQDTELLVDYAVRNIPEGECLLDLCTGSGCVAISTLKNTKGTRAVAIDISDAALRIAERNAERNGVCDRIAIKRCDVLAEEMTGEYFAVLSNPPYVTETAYSSLEPELYFEPRLALVGGGEDGCEFYERITSVYKTKIKPNGFIAFEIGFDQGGCLRRIASAHGMECEIIKDYSGNDRVAVLRQGHK